MSRMHAVLMSDVGGPDVLYIGQTDIPAIGPDDVLIRVKATALNRADLLQRRGLYPPPPGASSILGLEAAGEIAAVGEQVTERKPGDRVCALLPGGGYAEYVSVPSRLAMPIPDSLSYEEAAAIPEAFLTAYMNLFWLGELKSGDTVLVHAGASGVGTAAIQLAALAGGKPYATAGSSDKLDLCRSLGAISGWNYRDGSFAQWIDEQTNGRGVDLILDFIGAPYVHDNFSSLAVDGKLVIIGTLGGAKAKDVPLGMLLSKRLQVKGTTLRSQSKEKKIELTQQFCDFAMPALASGKVRAVIDTVYDWKEAGAAHAYMESNANKGKIVLKR